MSVIIDGSAGITYPVVAGTSSALQASAGKVLQVVSTIKQDTFSMSGASFVEITGLTVSITPTTTSNKVLVQVSLGRVGPNSGVGSTVAFQLFRGATVVGAGTPTGSQLATSFVTSASSNTNYSFGGFAFQFLDSPSSTSSITYSIKMLAESSTTAYINRSFAGGTTAATYDAASSSTITVMEIAA
mgnify:CR=1 FL=1|tara:strand:- start:442 stop:999 length:558 start_codon:yes stop_codon:yes gene_type:complete